MLPSMIWVAKNLYFFNCLLDGAHTKICGIPFLLVFKSSFLGCNQDFRNRKSTINVMISDPKKESHTPFSPQNFANSNAHNPMATMPRMREPKKAGRALPIAEKYATRTILMPATRKARK